MDGTTIYRDARNRSLGMVYLRPEAHAAYVLWLNRWYRRIDQQLGMPVREERSAAKLAGHSEACAQLATFVLTDAAATPLPPRPSDGGHHAAKSQAEFAAAERIRDEHDRLDPPAAPAALAWDDSEVCSHGVSLDDDCGDCAA